MDAKRLMLLGVHPSIDQATLQITVVINVNDEPIWSSNPLVKPAATADASYGATLAGDASGVDAGTSLTFVKVSGPVWLSVAADGELSGTPGSGDVELNSFTVEVSDGNGGTARTTLEIRGQQHLPDWRLRE